MKNILIVGCGGSGLSNIRELIKNLETLNIDIIDIQINGENFEVLNLQPEMSDENKTIYDLITENVDIFKIQESCENVGKGELLYGFEKKLNSELFSKTRNREYTKEYANEYTKKQIESKYLTTYIDKGFSKNYPKIPPKKLVK
jgi:hypothetical protein